MTKLQEEVTKEYIENLITDAKWTSLDVIQCVDTLCEELIKSFKQYKLIKRVDYRFTLQLVTKVIDYAYEVESELE